MRDRSSSVKAEAVSGQPHQGLNVLLDAWSVDRAIGDLLTRAISPSGLTADEFAVYSLLARQGPLTPSQLAEQMAAPPTTVSSYVTRFEARGHITRERNPRDGRSYRISLTSEGRRSHRRAAELFRPARQAVEEALGAAEPGVRQALAQLREAVDVVRAGTASEPGTPEALT
ncbi:MAG TPA: MarR family transcriptional regulator [Ornithinibacter sp.]|nr:MarR family transcriptional regulator [Ornithinibacter sp.]